MNLSESKDVQTLTQFLLGGMPAVSRELAESLAMEAALRLNTRARYILGTGPRPETVAEMWRTADAEHYAPWGRP